MALRIVSPKSHRLNDGKEGKTDPKKQKRPNPVLRLLAFLITAAMVLGAVYLILNYDKLNFDAVKRWFAYRDLERGENGQAESFMTGTAPVSLPAWTATCWCAPPPGFGSTRPAARCMWTAPW